MKKIVVLLCVMIISIAQYASNIVSFSSVSGHPNDEVSVSVSIGFTDAVSALEVLVPLDENVRFVDGSCILSSKVAETHQIDARQVDNSLKIYLYSLSLKNLTISEGELLSFKLRLGNEPADYVLTPNILLSNSSGDKLAEVSSVSGLVTILSPKIEIETKSIDFGHIPIRSVYTETLRIRNVGNEPLDVSDIKFDVPELSASETKMVIASGETKSVVVTYNPKKAGKITTTAYVSSNAVNVSKKNPPIATIIADPFAVNELHLSGASGMSDSIVTIQVSMNNMDSIVAMQCDLSLPNELVYVDGSVKLLSRSNGHSVNASYNNGKLSLYAYSLNNKSFEDFDGVLMSFQLRLNGESNIYYMSPTNVILSNADNQNVVSAYDGNSVEIYSPTIYANDNLDLGTKPLTEDIKSEYHVYNYGRAPLIIDKVTFLSENFSVETKLPIVIEPYESGVLVVNHQAKQEGKFATTMQVYSNDPKCRMKSVAVSGFAYEPNNLSVSAETSCLGSYQMSFDLANYSDIVALQFDIDGLSNAVYKDDETILSERLAQHKCSVTEISSGKYRVIVYSMSNCLLKGNEGEILSLNFSSDTPTKTNLLIDNIVISNKAGVNKSSSNPISLYAEYGVPIEYNVFITSSENGSEKGSGVYKCGDVAVLSATANEGYHFVRWSNGVADNPYRFALESDTTFSAIYERNVYRISYYVDDELYKIDSCEFGREVVLIAEPEKEGYTFSGWMNDVVSMPSNDITVRGSFAVNKYNVSFISEGVVLQESEMEYNSLPKYLGEEVTKPATDKYTYTFVGWSPEISVVKSDAEYVAVFEEHIKTSTVVTSSVDNLVRTEFFDIYGRKIKDINGGVYFVKYMYESGKIELRKFVVVR